LRDESVEIRHALVSGGGEFGRGAILVDDGKCGTRVGRA
jgi:hypothetical protein